MDIMELGAIGELVGGFAVLVTLVYLALQVRQTNRFARTQVHQEATRISNEVLLDVSRETLDLYDTAIRDPDRVSESDWRVLRNHWSAVINYFEALFYSWERGEVDEDLWESRVYRMVRFIGPHQERFWAPMKGAWGVRFQGFVDALLADQGEDAFWFTGGPRSPTPKPTER